MYKVIGVSLTTFEDRKLPLISTSYFYTTVFLGLLLLKAQKNIKYVIYVKEELF